MPKISLKIFKSNTRFFTISKLWAIHRVFTGSIPNTHTHTYSKKRMPKLLQQVNITGPFCINLFCYFHIFYSNKVVISTTDFSTDALSRQIQNKWQQSSQLSYIWKSFDFNIIWMRKIEFPAKKSLGFFKDWNQYPIT